MIDKALIGKTFPAYSAEVEKGRLRFFAKAIGETNPIFVDEHAAQAAGYRSLPVPPTFIFTLELEQPDPLAWFLEVGFDLAKMLHGEQSFVYHAPVCAGDVLSFTRRISQIYDKKNGALEFVVRETRVTNQDGCHVADLTAVIIQRNA
ncbi:MAG: MaoC family dehydratase N-terminal domain-containing protein [Proteobacteria bacterium]|nr:MaoC family dehydratase N-terminal domain-containing protein [Pseudomonadota bacterium]